LCRVASVRLYEIRARGDAPRAISTERPDLRIRDEHEYNHGIPGALKNAIDYLYREWNNKAAGFVSHGWRWRRTSGW